MVGLNGGVWQQEVTEGGTVWRQTEPGRPSSGPWEEAVQQQSCSSFLILHSHLLGLMGCCLIPEQWETLRTATNLPSNKASSSPISPLRRGGYLKTNLYTGARRHQGSPPSKAAEEAVVWAKSTCLDKVVERERVPASSPRQTLLSPAMALLLDLHPVLCWLHPFTGQVNSIIHQETESAGGEGMRGISAGLTELNSAQKRLAQVIGRKQKIFRRKGGWI